jgi:CRISPR/Cas system-associated protein Cas10 (large subunit of type III CRISPR-Cas system)
MPNVAEIDETSIRRIIREETKAAATEAVHEYLSARAQMLGPLFNIKVSADAKDPVRDLASAVGELIKPRSTAPGQRTCSFCGTHESKLNKLVGSPHGVHICDRCIKTAHDAAK